mmetsp:Transcript_26288/g.48008  ORF Transcript_26288/g.48008 Transcript_26288/m.48008 type:complete len:316 (-) Transcript_26288:79-1026(-)
MLLRVSWRTVLSTLFFVCGVSSSSASSQHTCLLAHQVSRSTGVVEEESERSDTWNAAVVEELKKVYPKGHGDLLTEEQHAVMCYLKQQFESTFNSTETPEAMRRPHDSCAIVSNSGALLNFEYGREIDKHDVVMRFNNAPVVGYEMHVGRRTDVRFGWTFGNFKNDTSAYAREKVEWETQSLGAKVLDRLYPLKMGFTAHTDEPTTGFVGMLLALFNCELVETYEMSPSDGAQDSPYAYYKDTHVHATQNSWHSFFRAEHDLWARLSTTELHEVKRTGKTRSLGFRSIHCANDNPAPESWEPPRPHHGPVKTAWS